MASEYQAALERVDKGARIRSRRMKGMSYLPSLAAQEFLDSLTHWLTDSEPGPLLLQLSILLFGELGLLYAVRKSRGAEVYVFSHIRLWIATAIVAAMSLAYYQLAVSLHPSERIRLIIYYPILLFAMLPLVSLQQLSVMLVDKVGANPITKDFARPELHGGDFHSAVIRRFAPFVLLWLLLIPGLILLAPIPDWLHYVLLGLWTLPANGTLASMTLRS